MSEKITLITPIVAPSITDYRMVRIVLEMDTPAVFLLARSNTGDGVEYIERGQAAINLMSSLNTANLSIKSLQRRALEYMASKGVFAGTISGTPD